MWLSSPVPPCHRRVWCVTGLLLAARLFLLSAEMCISAVHVQPSGLQDRSCGLVMVLFIFLNMWALIRSWPVRSLMTTTCCHRSRKWKSPLSMRCPRAALIRVFFSWKVALLSCCLPLAPSLASSSAFSFPGRPQ